VLLLYAMTALARTPPQRVSAGYNLLKNGQPVAVVSETFTRSGNRYHIVSETRGLGVFALLAKGSVRLISSGEVTRAGLKPLHFEYQRGSDPAKTLSADFNWQTNTLTLRHDGQSETVALKPGSQDRVSLMYQFMFMAHRPADLVFYMTNGKKLSRYHYRRDGEEKLDTPLGLIRTLHYTRQHRLGEDGTEVWLAVNRHHFPVQVLIEEKDGGTMEQVLTRLSIE
jgi:hypothetical protein